MSSQDKKRGDNVASPRSSSRLEKKNNKTGEQHQQEFTKFVKNLLKGLDIQLQVEPNVNTINSMLNKKNKKKLN
tara:strand:- start:16 stop:237 length:222 start_codon:yes stop_codon:yes gene_type:complete